ncbi:MAG TPA: hypothetical protein VH679_08515 [Vicinamibacterales bacterium]
MAAVSVDTTSAHQDVTRFMGLFRRSSPSSADRAWWHEAEAASAAPSSGAIARLRQALASVTSLDEKERREEFVEGLERVLELSSNGGLPSLVTQHRVIGTDVCHFVAPVSLAGQMESAGKLFLTSQRIVFAGHGVQAWPWHRVRGVIRLGRDLAITVAGLPEPVHIQCNSYADAMSAHYMSSDLASRKP